MKKIVSLVLSLVAMASTAPMMRADDTKTVQIQASDQMKYDVTAIDATVGQKSS
jgi:azurin